MVRNEEAGAVGEMGAWDSNMAETETGKCALSVLKESNQQMRKDLNQTQDKLLSTEATLEEERSALLALRDDNQRLKEQARQMRKDLSAAQEKLLITESALMESEITVQEQRQQIFELEEEVTRMRDHVKGINEEFSASQMELMEKDTILETLHDEREKIREQAELASPKPKRVSDMALTAILEEQFEQYSDNLQTSGILQDQRQLHCLAVRACFALQLRLRPEEIESRVQQYMTTGFPSNGINFEAFSQWFCASFPEILRS